MFPVNSSLVSCVSLLVLSALVVGCGGGTSVVDTQPPDAIAPLVETPIDITDASIVTRASKLSGGIVRKSGNDFSFPEISTLDGGVTMTIPAGPLPSFPARRTIMNGSGQTIEFGDPVTLKYDMFAWSDGELVESSSLFEEAHTVQGGVSDDFSIPEYLAKSLLGRSLGDTVQVVLPVGTPDLPTYLDHADAYIVVVELL